MVGYPASWHSYANIAIDRADLVKSVRNIMNANWRQELASTNRPADPNLWFLSPQQIDAFSDQSRVAFGVTAALLQPPWYDPDVDAAANYGAVGEAIGHELTHQFDDQGRKYDKSGSLRNWWTASDAARFETSAAGLARQYSEFEVLSKLFVDGKQTLSENIADLGGLLLALDAYRLSLAGKPAPVIGGLTGDQRLFLAWARVFRSKERDAVLEGQALSGTHTPFKFRVIGPMRNVNAWYTAFGVKPGDKYYLKPSERVRIW